MTRVSDLGDAGVTPQPPQCSVEVSGIRAGHEQLVVEAALLVKVKEPQPAEIAHLTAHHVLFTYPHLAADPPLLTHSPQPARHARA